MNSIWQRYLCYLGLLATSLVLQLLRPDMFAILCTALPIGLPISQPERLDLPLNAPIATPGERIK